MGELAKVYPLAAKLMKAERTDLEDSSIIKKEDFRKAFLTEDGSYNLERIKEMNKNLLEALRKDKDNEIHWLREKVKAMEALMHRKMDYDNAVNNLTDFQKYKLQHLFNLWDANNNGKVTVDDFTAQGRKVAELNGVEFNDEISARWMKQFQRLDSKKQWSITLEDYIEVYADFLYGTAAVTVWDWMDTVSGEFFRFDVMNSDRNGVVSKQEFVNHHVAVGIPRDEAIEGFSVVDIDKDGHISEVEFRRCFALYLLAEDESSPYNTMWGNLSYRADQIRE